MAKPRAAVAPSPRRRLPRSERRSRILEAALEVFAGKGYRDASMAELAAAAGVTPPVLYQHFASKQELFLAVVRHQASLLATAIGDAADPTSAPLEQRVVKTATAILTFVADRPQAWRLLRTTPPVDPAIATAYAQLHRGARQLTAQTTASDRHFTAPPGVDRTSAAELFGHLQWTAYEALGDWAAAHPELEHSDLLRIFMDFMWVGLEHHHQGSHWPGQATR
jgi:AcrR family transcriptional regulator